jgi:hypothetical protein
MKPYALDSKMFTISGVFYPTGHIMAMVPDHESAVKIAKELEAIPGHGEISLLEPAAIITDIGRTAVGSDDGDMPPSIGTESATVREYVELAQKGQYGLLVRVNSSEAAERVADVLRKNQFSYAQRYHMLVIEDIV